MVSRELARAARRFADQQSSRFEALPLAQRLVLTVSATSPLTVSWRGKDVPTKGANVATTLAVGDRVVCDLIDGQLIVDYVVG